MASCPTCAKPLEQDLAIFFCPPCRASLQPRRALASTLAVLEIVIAPDRFADPMGACPACADGQLGRAVALGESVAACSSCDAIWLNGEQLARMRARLARERAKKPAIVVLETDQERDAHVHRIAFDDPLTNRYAYPVALVAGLLTHLIGLSFLVWGTVEMWFHELGHAVVAWLSGFVAIPLPFFTSMPRETRSGWVVAITLGMIGAIAYESAKRRLWGLVAFAAVLALADLVLTFVLNPAQARQWGIFAGQAGAIVLPTLVMIAFYQPIGWRWDFWRYPAIVVAAVGLMHALFIWIGVARGTGVMPHGSAVGDDSEGDMERLVREYHWTKTSLASAYVLISMACLVVLFVTYLVFLRRSFAKHSSRA